MKGSKWQAWSLVLLAGTAATGMATPAHAADDAAARCAAFAQQSFGAEVKITAATHVDITPAGTAQPDGPPLATTLPAHCRVEGIVDERTGADGKTYGIGFALALPDDWNGRFLLMGGGGLNGTVHPPIGPVAAGDRPALARGFAVLSHDSGHKGAVFDASFEADQRAALDFAETSVHTVTLLGKAMTQRFYGRAIAHSYMTGCSTGGREGMLAAQRYPELFDGIVIGAPAMRTGNSNLGMAYAQVMFNQAAPRDAEGLPIVAQIFSPADRATLLKGILDACDGLDGLRDGMVMNVAQCRFRPATLQCTDARTDSCLSAAQVEALDKAFAGPKDSLGNPVYISVPYDTGVVSVDGPIPGYLPTGAPGIFGPPNRDLSIDLDARIAEVRADPVDRLTTTAFWTNLSTFLGHGGKTIFYHGVSDPWFSAFDTLDYWQRAAEANGPAWQEASRFYMVPGMGHCRGGNAFDQFDLLSAMVDWVEQGHAPGAVTATRGNGAAGERPMCPWPSYAAYVKGDADAAGSFACRTPDLTPPG